MENHADRPAADLRALDALLAEALYRADCPPADRLLEHSAGLLDADVARLIEAHLAICAHCQSEVALISAPPSTNPAARLAAGLAAARTLVRATLTGGGPALALRGAEGKALRYDAGTYQVIIGTIPPPSPRGTGQIEGQLIGGTSAGLAELLDGDALIQAGELDALGYFAFDDVAAGVYTIRLTHDVDLIIVEDVALR
jgi:anti-sigma factor RsiW